VKETLVGSFNAFSELLIHKAINFLKMDWWRSPEKLEMV